MKKCFGGIDLGGSFIKAGLIDVNGNQITKFKIPTEEHKGSDEIKVNLKKAAAHLLGFAEKKRITIKGIGVGSPGTIRYPEGLVTDATPNIANWVGTRISAIFKGFSLKIAVDNDANCMGLAEATFGAGKGTESGLYVTLGTGVGGALIMNGKLHRGASFAAGEFGHTIFQYDGKLCKSGRRGCLEGYIAAPAMIEEARRIINQKEDSGLNYRLDALTPEDIFRFYKAGNRTALEIVRKNAEMVGVAIGSAVNLINPEIVVIGGGLSHGGPKYISLIRRSALQFAFRSATRKLKIVRAKFGNDAGWIGAACLIIDDGKQR
jgi:glucokinase